MVAARIAGAAALIAVLTVASRLAGFGRTLVFTWAVGVDELADVYNAANLVPNIVFEIVAGGALASLVVPVLAAPLARDDRLRASATASALLTRVVLGLVPVAVAVALAAGPIVRLIDRNASPEEEALATDLLRVFAPQLPLYGIGIVLSGVLQAHRRFVWPVLAPLLSSVTVSVSYLLFALVVDRSPEPGNVGGTGVLVLAGGTTLGVAVLSLSLLVPVQRLGLKLRPGLALGAVAGPVRRLATAGAVTVGAQYASLAVVVATAAAGPGGSVSRFMLAQTVYLVPWAVLVLPIATSAFPVLSAAHATGDTDRFTTTTAAAVRGALLAGAFGAGALIAVSPDAARVLAGLAGQPDAAGSLSAGITGLAPGVLGYGLFALLSRVLYARGTVGPAAAATAVGWVVATAAAVTLAAVRPPADRVGALAAGTSIGLLVMGAALLALTRRHAGSGALAGAARTGVAAVTAAGLAAAAVLALRSMVVPGALAGAVLGGLLFTVGYALVVYAVDRGNVRPVLAAVATRLRRRNAHERRVQGEEQQ